CRTGHGFFGEYFAHFVPTNDQSCPCGEPLQTREHILAECPIYDDHRETLCEASEDLIISDLLGTEEGIKALVTFIRQSGAFKKLDQPNHPPDGSEPLSMP
ncbi:hypothetical protein HYDPIDRAFT_84672, partial [Hydnomerulius pinastri MD-312]